MSRILFFKSLINQRNSISIRVEKFFCTLCLLLLSIQASAQNLTVEGVRIWHAPDHSRVVFDISQKADYSISLLNNPDRFVIDFKQASLKGKIPVNESNQRIDQIRAGQLNNSVYRVVIPIKKNLSGKGFQLTPNELYGHRLVIDLYDLPVGQKSKVISEESRQEVVVQTEPNNTQSSIQQQDYRPNQSDKRQVVIAIDAGHGGEDPGAVGSRSYEKNITLAVSRRLARLINNTPQMKAVLIRDSDYFVRLRTRTTKARQANADLFVSIHADAALNKSARGMSVFALSQRGASSELARALARKENQADLVGGVSIKDKDDELAQVLLDLSLTNKISESVELGRFVLNRLSKLGKLHSKRVEQAGFVVLKSPDIPSILVETGFITNRSEEARLITSGFQQQLAEQIYAGIVEYINKNPVQVANANFQITPSTHTIVDLPEIEDQFSTTSTVSFHTVKTGDSLSKIAEQYGISLSQLKQWNNLRSNVAVKGKRLRVSAPSRSSGDNIIQNNSQTIRYTVKRGDTLSTIAERYGDSMQSIRRRNNMKSSNVYIGQRLQIVTTSSQTSSKPSIHIVKRGEYLSSISQKYNISIQAIKRLNGLNSNNIYIGQKLRVSNTGQSSVTNSSNLTPVIHTVQRGEYLSGISERYNISIQAIKDLNGLKSNNIYVGQKLTVSSSGQIESIQKSIPEVHTVKRGEYLSGISQKYNISISAIKDLNGLRSNNIYVGQKLKLPSVTKNSKPTLKTITHTVRSGETLSGLAEKYAVKQSDVIAWNKLKKNELLIGQKLSIQTTKSL